MTRKPTDIELSNPDIYPRIELTYETPMWDPHDATFAHLEANLRNNIGHLSDLQLQSNDFFPANASAISTVLRSISSVYDPCSFGSLVISTSRFNVSSSSSIRRKGTISAQDLARRWRISIDLAERTIERTTQLGVRDYTSMQGTRRLRHSNQQFSYRRLNAVVFTDTMHVSYASLQGNKCAQVYVTDFEWTKLYPIRSKADAHLTLDLLHKQYGVFHTIVPDNANELIKGDYLKKARKAGAIVHSTEAFTPNQNRAESAIRELKRLYRRTMLRSNAPKVLWDHCFQLQAEIRSHTAMNLSNLFGDVPLTVLLGDTADISHLCQFEWYERIWYIDPDDPMINRKLGRYLGPSHQVGDHMSCKVLIANGRLINRTSIFPLSEQELSTTAVKDAIVAYDKQLDDALGERAQPVLETDYISPGEREIFESPEFEPYEDEHQPDVSMPEADTMDFEGFDKYISARLMLPDESGILQKAQVKRRKKDRDGKLIGRSNANPLLDSSVYEVEFEDGTDGCYSANVIAENIFEQVDAEGNRHTILEAIVDHKRMNNALTLDEAYVTVNGRQHPKRTTLGWKFCVMWKDGSTSWIPLKDMKESHPLQVCEYVMTHGLDKEPAFSWWVPKALKRQHIIIKAIKQNRYFRKNEKFGLEIPKTVKRALEIDKENGNTYWEDAIKKEMGVIAPVFEILDDGQVAPLGYQKIPCHIIFDIKFDFTRKARFVAGGHKTEPPQSITYASVVSRDSVRIAFMIAALNDLDILAADVQGAYLNAPCKERVYTICGPEFGARLEGRVGIIKKALYGLKSSGFAWRSHLATTLRDIGFDMCLADNDVWMRAASTPDGSSYYEYVLVYTDDILCISLDPKSTLMCLDQHYILKESSIGKPTQYLGAQIGEYRLPDQPEKVRWSISSEKYVKEAIRTLEDWLDNHNLQMLQTWALKSKAETVMPSGYRPELDASAYCGPELAHYYQQQIGVLRWAVELGRINICTEVSMLAAFTVAPRIGHFNAMLHIFAFLKHHPRCRLVMDDNYVDIKYPQHDIDWQEFYPDVQEEIPPNAPSPRGKPVQMIAFVDSDHAGDTVTRRSRTGVLIYLNCAPILWYSKKQSCVETSTFGSEFMGLKTGIDLIIGLRYKCRMMGIPANRRAYPCQS